MSCWRWGAAAAARPTHSMECLAELVGVPTGSLDLEVALAYLRVPGPNRKCGTPFSGWQQRLVPHIGVPDHAPLRTRRSSPQTFPSLQWHLRSGDRQAQLQLRRGGGRSCQAEQAAKVAQSDIGPAVVTGVEPHGDPEGFAHGVGLANPVSEELVVREGEVLLEAEGRGDVLNPGARFEVIRAI